MNSLIKNSLTTIFLGIMIAIFFVGMQLLSNYLHYGSFIF